MTHRTPARLKFAVLAVGICALGTAASGSAGSSPGSSLPNQATQGQVVGVAVAVRPAGARCTIKVRYANGATQPGLKPVVARSGRAAWKWRVPDTAAPGSARVQVACGKTGQLDRTFTVVAKPKTAPKVVIEKQGFSFRYLPTSGAVASVGLILKNTSPDEDALNVQVLINFLDPANVVVGSINTTVPAVSAASTYNYGNSLNWQGAPTVSRIEVVVSVHAHAPKAQKYPALANLRFFASPYDPGYVGEVDGELLNNQQAFALGNAQLSIVVLDAAGNVIGGGTGSTFAAIPPGARMLFKATSGFKAIKVAEAASVLVSTLPSWQHV